MLIVAGTIDVDVGDRDRFLASRAEQVRASRLEHGCLAYGFAADVDDPGRIHLFERWTDDDALEAHLAGLKAAAAPDDGPAPVAVLARDITIYQVAATRPAG